MTVDEIIQHAQDLPGVEIDSPFSDIDATVLRHGYTRRWFGLILDVPEKYYGQAERALNLKCSPELIGLLTEKYDTVFPAYHMNKTHWITVRLCADKKLITDLLELSYHLTESGKKGR